MICRRPSLLNSSTVLVCVLFFLRGFLQERDATQHYSRVTWSKCWKSLFVFFFLSEMPVGTDRQNNTVHNYVTKGRLLIASVWYGRYEPVTKDYYEQQYSGDNSLSLLLIRGRDDAYPGGRRQLRRKPAKATHKPY